MVRHQATLCSDWSHIINKYTTHTNIHTDTYKNVFVVVVFNVRWFIRHSVEFILHAVFHCLGVREIEIEQPIANNIPGLLRSFYLKYKGEDSLHRSQFVYLYTYQYQYKWMNPSARWCFIIEMENFVVFVMVFRTNIMPLFTNAPVQWAAHFSIWCLLNLFKMIKWLVT